MAGELTSPLFAPPQGTDSGGGFYKRVPTADPAVEQEEIQHSGPSAPHSQRRAGKSSRSDDSSLAHHRKLQQQPGASHSCWVCDHNNACFRWLWPEGAQCLRGQIFLESGVFQFGTVLLILANAICMGFETDMPHAFRWEGLEFIFLLLFSLELWVRISIVGVQQFFSVKCQDFTWNMLDMTLVASGILSLMIDVVVGSKANVSDTTLFRMVRLLRLARVLRIIRIVRFLKQLYLLAYGFVEGGLAVFWVTLLAAALLYICSILLVRTYGHEWEDEPDAHRDFFHKHFGSIPKSMYSLFQLMCAPDLRPWHDELFEYPWLVFFLVTFIIVGSFGVNGLLVALINESILERNQARIEAERLDREAKRMIVQHRCHEIFDQLDLHRNRVLPRAELSKCKDKIAELIEQVNVDFRGQDLDQMFYIMDYNDTGIIEREEFVSSVVELCDQIRPMSIMELHCQVSKCSAKVDDVDSKIDTIGKSLESAERRKHFEDHLAANFPEDPVLSARQPHRRATSPSLSIDMPRPVRRVFVDPHPVNSPYNSEHPDIPPRTNSRGMPAPIAPKEALATGPSRAGAELGNMMTGSSANSREVREALAAHYLRLAEAQQSILLHLKATATPADSEARPTQALIADQVTLAELGHALTALQRTNTDVLEVVLTEVSHGARRLQESNSRNRSGSPPTGTRLHRSKSPRFVLPTAHTQEGVSERAAMMSGRDAASAARRADSR